jgi:hypothetical protein
MEKFLVWIEKTGTGYSAFIPGLPGIASAGDTFDEIRENIRFSGSFIRICEHTLTRNYWAN